MEERVVVVNKTLEEFLERLLRWGELCEQLRELYYKYLDLAAFRSEKCFFPGRRCKRSWNRQYDVGDLTLMWTYITNTAPLCGKLMKALAEVEYKIRLKALESLEKHGGIMKTSRPKKRADPDYKVVWFNLNEPIYAYVVLWNKLLYVVWGELDNLPRNAQLRVAEIERKIRRIIEDYERGKNVNVEIWSFDLGSSAAYEQLILEVPLPKTVSKLLNGKDSAPIILFRNLGWLASDDSRHRVEHGSGVSGQTVLRLLDWIVLAKYAIDVLKIESQGMLIFKLIVRSVSKTRRGYNPSIVVSPIGLAARAIQGAYSWFGVTLGKSEEVLAHIYALIKALRFEAFGLERGRYVVNDVGAWIALSAMLNTMILGDGHVLPYEIRIAVKSTPESTLEGITLLRKELAKAVGGSQSGDHTVLQHWHVRLLLPAPPVPIFEKSRKLYKVIVEYPVAAVVEVGNIVYVLYNYGGAKFAIGREKGAKLYEELQKFNVTPKVNKYRIILTFKQLEELRKRGVKVKFLNDMEGEGVRRVVPTLSAIDIEAVSRVLEDLLRAARVIVATSKGRVYIRIIPHNKQKLMELASRLQEVGIKVSVMRKWRKEIRVYERSSVETLLKVLHFFHPLGPLNAVNSSGGMARQ